MNPAEVFAFNLPEYNCSDIFKVLPEDIFSNISPGDKIILKPNWIRESHLLRQDEWEQVITHPTVITAVLQKVLEKLKGIDPYYFEKVILILLKKILTVANI